MLSKEFSRSLIAAASLSILTLFAITFSFSPMTGEDYALGPIAGTTSFNNRLASIALRMTSQWLEWNARLGEALSIFWLGMPKAVFDTAAVAAFAFYCFLTTGFAVRSFKLDDKFALGCLMTGAISYMLWPQFELFFWRTVAAGYFFPILLTLGFVAIISLPTVTKRVYSGPYYLAAVVLAFFVGTSFESLPPAILIFGALNWLVASNDRNRFRHFLPDMGLALSLLAGWIVLITAPSTPVRVQYYRQHMGYEPTFTYYWNRMLDAVWNFYSTTIVLAAVALVLLALLIFRHGLKSQKDVLCLLVPAGLCVATVALAPYTEPRAFSFAWAIGIIICVRGVMEFANPAMLSVIVLCGITSAATTLPMYVTFDRLVSEREAYVISHIGKPECQTGLPISEITYNPDSSRLLNRDTWVMSTMQFVSSHYGCHLVKR